MLQISLTPSKVCCDNNGALKQANVDGVAGHGEESVWRHQYCFSRELAVFNYGLAPIN